MDTFYGPLSVFISGLWLYVQLLGELATWRNEEKELSTHSVHQDFLLQTLNFSFSTSLQNGHFFYSAQFS